MPEVLKIFSAERIKRGKKNSEMMKFKPLPNQTQLTAITTLQI